MKSPTGQLYVAVWDIHPDSGERLIDRLYEWHEWLRIPIEGRPLTTTMVRGRDELEAYRKALKGNEWYSDID